MANEASDKVDPPALNMPISQRLQLAREIARLIRARLPLEKSLAQLSQQSSGSFANSIAAVCERLQQGHTLAGSLAPSADRPTQMLAANIELGQLSGQIELSIEHWVNYYLTRQRYFRRLSSALVYPILLIITALGSILFSAYRLLPQYQDAFAQLVDKQPAWLTTLAWLRENYWLLASTTTLCVIVVLWLSIRRRWGLSASGLPKNAALQGLIHSQVASLSRIGLASGQPIQTWLPWVARSVGLFQPLPTNLVEAPAEWSHNLGRETFSVLLGLQTNQMSASDADALLATIATHAESQAEAFNEREVQQLPMLASAGVGAVAVITYLGLIYLPWVALFYCVASEA